jgi:uncharacterized membrane protein
MPAMSTSTVLFLLLRAAHVLLAAIWVGATAFTTFVLMPALQESGPAAGPVMSALMRRKFSAFMAVLGGTTVLTGLYLYYRFTGGFDPALSGSMGARVFGAGGIAGIASVIIGGSVVSRSGKKMEALGARLASAPEAERAAVAAELTATRQRIATFSKIVFVLQIIALILMAIGHYV